MKGKKKKKKRWADQSVYHLHHKYNGSRFDNNSRAKFAFHRFIWNKHECHSFTYVI
jgi:hypothetical protein